MATNAKKGTEVLERFILIINRLTESGVFRSKTEIASAIGLSPQALSEILGRRNNPSLEVLQKLFKNYGVNAEWLFLGEGSPFNLLKNQTVIKPEVHITSLTQKQRREQQSNQVKELRQVTENLSQVSEPRQNSVPTKHFGMPVVATVDEGGNDNIVMVDIKAAAGYAQNFTEPKFVSKLPAMKLHGSEFRNGIFRGYQVDGDSMYDTLDHNDWVVGRYLDNHWQDIKEGYIHVVVTKTEVTIKRLLNRVEERGKIVLLSDNDQYPTRDLDVEEVSEFWLVKARLSYNLRSRRVDWFKKYNDVQAEMVDIKHRLTKLERAGKLK